MRKTSTKHTNMENSMKIKLVGGSYTCIGLLEWYTSPVLHPSQ